MRAQKATVVDIAALLGVTPARIRQIISERKIKPTGHRWKAKLYDPNDFLDLKVGHHRRKDRQQ